MLPSSLGPDYLRPKLLSVVCILTVLAAGCVNAGPPKRLTDTTVQSGVVGGGARSAGPLAWRLGDDVPLDSGLPETFNL